MEKSNTLDQGFESWAILEIFGHVKYAGKVDEVEIAGAKMIRVTVPEIKANGGLPEFQRIFGTSSVYSLTPVSEDYARGMAENLRKHPIEGYEHKEVVTKMAKAYAEKVTLQELKHLISTNQLKAPTEPNSSPGINNTDISDEFSDPEDDLGF